MNTLPIFTSVAILAAVAGIAPVQADSVTITNPSFESPGVSGVYAVTGEAQGAPTNNNQNTVPGWAFSNNEWSGTYGNPFNDGDGSRVAFINVKGSSGNAFITSAAPATTVLANTNYVLTVAIGDNTGTGDFADPGNIILNLLVADPLDPNDYSVAATNMSPIDNTSFSGYGQPGDPGSIQDFSITLSADVATIFAGDDLEIQIEASNPVIQGNYQPVFDNVRLTATAAPEPSAYAMILVGLALVGIGLRRKLA